MPTYLCTCFFNAQAKVYMYIYLCQALRESYLRMEGSRNAIYREVILFVSLCVYICLCVSLCVSVCLCVSLCVSVCLCSQSTSWPGVALFLIFAIYKLARNCIFLDFRSLHVGQGLRYSGFSQSTWWPGAAFF